MMKTNKPEYIIIHHSASKDHGTLDFVGLRDWHVNHNGWPDIGYNFVLEDINGRYTAIMGRHPNDIGYHCSGMNHKSLGICFVGNFEKSMPPVDQWNLGVRLVRWLLEKYNLSTHRVEGHRYFKATACPGKNFNMQKFKDDIGYI